MLIPENPGRQIEPGDEEPAFLSDFQPPGAHRFVILVTDDNALVRNLIGLVMQQDGHFVLCAADGHEGLELSRKYPGTIDLVITDVQVPRLNRTDLCAHLMEERPGNKILMMSTADAGYDTLAFLRKPFDGCTLKARVRTILSAPRQLIDVTRLISELRNELERINREMRSLQRPDTWKKNPGARFVRS